MFRCHFPLFLSKLGLHQSLASFGHFNRAVSTWRSVATRWATPFMRCRELRIVLRRFGDRTYVRVGTLLLSGCAGYGSVDGVDNLWREVSVDEFERGVTTQAEILDRLGPPSQLIALNEQTVFYYLTEEMSGSGKIFIVWNQFSAESKYDRAVFFFDTEGVLQELAYSKEEISR